MSCPRRAGRRRGTWARRRDDGIAAVFSSDLGRAVETAAIAFDGSGIPALHDWRLRECDYGQLNGMPADEMHRGRLGHLDWPYPGGKAGGRPLRVSVASSMTCHRAGRAAGSDHRARRHPLGP